MREEVDGTVEIGTLPKVSGDPALLRQLMINLIGNGLKFRRPDVPPLVRVHANREGSDWQLEVIDNGIGIEPDYTDKVFVIFQRLHARDSYAGTGIGLALAKKIVEFHGGQITVLSASGPGTTIRFTLPAMTEET
jgi:light-regulated signal transduction histidine kinase (bacteriophytochrome)